MRHEDIGVKCSGRLIRQSRLGPVARKRPIVFICNVCDAVLAERALQQAVRTHKRNTSWKKQNAPAK